MKQKYLKMKVCKDEFDNDLVNNFIEISNGVAHNEKVIYKILGCENRSRQNLEDLEHLRLIFVSIEQDLEYNKLLRLRYQFMDELVETYDLIMTTIMRIISEII